MGFKHPYFRTTSGGTYDEKNDGLTNGRRYVVKAFVHGKERQNGNKIKNENKNKQRQGSNHVGISPLKSAFLEVLTTIEAANYLRISVETLRNMTSAGKIPYTKLGNRNRYFLNELRELLRSNKRGGGSNGI